MAGTLFSTFYQDIRVASGNDDPDIGTEVMPDARIDTLLMTVARTFRSFSETLPELTYQDETVQPVPPVDPPVPSEWSLSLAATPGKPITNIHLLNAIAFAAAYKYYVGIGNTDGVAATMGALQKEVELYAGYAISEVNSFRFDYYNRLRTQQMQGNLLNF